jgi:hypothetical protein
MLRYWQRAKTRSTGRYKNIALQISPQGDV